MQLAQEASEVARLRRELEKVKEEKKSCEIAVQSPFPEDSDNEGEIDERDEPQISTHFSNASPGARKLREEESELTEHPALS